MLLEKPTSKPTISFFVYLNASTRAELWRGHINRGKSRTDHFWSFISSPLYSLYTVFDTQLKKVLYFADLLNSDPCTMFPSPVTRVRTTVRVWSQHWKQASNSSGFSFASTVPVLSRTNVLTADHEILFGVLLSALHHLYGETTAAGRLGRQAALSAATALTPGHWT
jgi:hypothetical protein